MTETRKLAAILVADIVGYSRLAGLDEEGTLARLRSLRGELIDPTIALHNGRLVKRTGDGAIVEFRSVVEAVRFALEAQSGILERNAGLPDDKRIEARVGIHLGDVVEEADGDLMGDGVNIAARLEGVCPPGGICLSEDAYRQVRDRLAETFVDLGELQLKNIARPMRAYALTPTAGLHPTTRSAIAVGKSYDWRETKAPFAAAVHKILENVARLAGALAERLTSAGKPAIGSSGAAGHEDEKLRRRRLRRAIVFAVLVVAVARGMFRGREPSAPPPPAPAPAAALDNKLAIAPAASIVVLPFVNLSAAPEPDKLSDELAGALTTDLSRLPGAVVVSGAAASLKGRVVDLRQLGRELKARYALEGSVRSVGDTVTVNAQLFSTDTGAELWTDRYVAERGKAGDLKGEFVARIAAGLSEAGLNRP